MQNSDDKDELAKPIDPVNIWLDEAHRIPKRSASDTDSDYDKQLFRAAKVYMQTYNAFLKAGFTEAQAFQIVLIAVQTAFALSKK